VAEIIQKSILETVRSNYSQSSPASPTGMLRTDCRFKISFSAFLDDAVFALAIKRSTPSLVRLEYITSDKSHSLSFGMRQIGQGYIDLVPKIVVARVLPWSCQWEPNDQQRQHSHFFVVQNRDQDVKYRKGWRGRTIIKGKPSPSVGSANRRPQYLEVCCLVHLCTVLRQCRRVI
jgi:hypothetical protein